VTRRGGEIDFYGQTPDLRVTIEPALLRVILANLVQNSCEAYPQGEDIRISLETMEEADGKYLLLKLSDQGSGITHANFGKIFEFGYSTKDDHSGLGLPTVNFLLESFGGKVEIVSTAGRGTTVHVFVPAR